MIPKIIHYCWLSNDLYPAKIQNCVASWKKHLPDYELKLWNFECFDINSSIWVKQAFENKKYAFAADYIRLYALYHYGGIYLDMDVEVLKPFSNELLNQSAMIAFEDDKFNAIEAGILGGEKQSDWLNDCLDYYSDKSFILLDNSFDMKSLPLIMFNVLNEKYIKTNKIIPYTKDFFTAKSYMTGKIDITQNTYTIHHFAGSWLPYNQKISKILNRYLGKKITYKIFIIRRKIKLFLRQTKFIYVL